MNYTDEQLKRALAKMLSDEIYMGDSGKKLCYHAGGNIRPVLDTELLHLCWLVESSLSIGERMAMRMYLTAGNTLGHGYGEKVCHATWQQRVIALSRVKGIEI